MEKVGRFEYIQYHRGEGGSERTTWILLHYLLSIGCIGYSLQNHDELVVEGVLL